MDWHAMRRQGISSSDLSAMLGKSAYRSPWQVAREKRGQEPAEKRSEPTEDARWGTIMEPYVVARAMGELHGELLAPEDWPLAEGQLHRTTDGPEIRWVVTCRHEPLIRSTPDNVAIVAGNTVVVEAKTTGRISAWVNGVPQSVWLQCQWHMLATGLRATVVPVLFFGRTRRLKIYTVELHPSFDGPDCKAIAACRAWWQRHVVEGVDPEPMHLDIPYLANVHAKTDGTTLTLPACHSTLDDQYAALSEKRKLTAALLRDATDDLKSVEAKIRKLMGPAMFAKFEGKDAVFSLFTNQHGKRTLRRKS